VPVHRRGVSSIQSNFRSISGIRTREGVGKLAILGPNEDEDDCSLRESVYQGTVQGMPLEK